MRWVISFSAIPGQLYFGGNNFVCGPLADGKFYGFFKKHMDGEITFDEYFTGIRPISKGHNQLSLHTLESKSCIEHVEVETLETIILR